MSVVHPWNNWQGEPPKNSDNSLSTAKYFTANPTRNALESIPNLRDKVSATKVLKFGTTLTINVTAYCLKLLCKDCSLSFKSVLMRFWNSVQNLPLTAFCTTAGNGSPAVLSWQVYARQGIYIPYVGQQYGCISCQYYCQLKCLKNSNTQIEKLKLIR
jgi:hypothetical protein